MLAVNNIVRRASNCDYFHFIFNHVTYKHKQILTTISTNLAIGLANKIMRCK